VPLRPIYFTRRAVDALVRGPYVALVGIATIFVALFSIGLLAAALGGAEKTTQAFARQQYGQCRRRIDKGLHPRSHRRLVGMIEDAHHGTTPDAGPAPLEQPRQHVEHPGFGQRDGSPCEWQIGNHRGSSKTTYG
jgi:hypothetical protein